METAKAGEKTPLPIAIDKESKQKTEQNAKPESLVETNDKRLELKNGEKEGPKLESVECVKENRPNYTMNFRICALDCSTTFRDLTTTERLYAHYTAQAAFQGLLLTFLQISPSSGGLFVLLYRLFSSEPIEALRLKAVDVGVTELEWTDFILFTATQFSIQLWGRFIPLMSQSKLWKLVAVSRAASLFPDLVNLYESVELAIFKLNPTNDQIGFPDHQAANNSQSNSQNDNQFEYLCNLIVMRERLLIENTRFYKEQINGETILKIKHASVKSSFTEETINGVKVRLEKGHYAEILAAICDIFRKAGDYAANNNQKELMQKFAKCFESGKADDLENLRKLWLDDIDPIVRGIFMIAENTEKPPGYRSEFRGYVAAFNKESTKKYDILVANADRLLKRLPWGKAYEKDKFTRPDFAALDIIAYGFNTIMLGKNYVKEDSDSMGRIHIYSNLIPAFPGRTSFTKSYDQELIHEYGVRAERLSTGLHELLGHGSGKLFERKADGSFNFDRENTIDILTGEKIASWYEPGQSFRGLFGWFAVPFEECRAFAVEYVMCGDKEILSLMGHEGECGQMVKYVAWLKLIVDGLFSLGQYNDVNNEWQDPHSWARFVLMKVLLEAGEGCLVIEETKDSEGRDDLSISLDKKKIDSVGIPAMMDFLKKLQAYKSTADVNGATALFQKYSVGPNEIKWRTILFARPFEPPTILVQPNTVLAPDGDVKLVTYPESAEGIIRSVVDRYSAQSVASMEKLWKSQ